MDISRIEGLEVGKRLITRKPGQKGSLEWESIVVIEGFSHEYNFIYGRVRHGKTIGTMLNNVPGFGAVCISNVDLQGLEVICK